MTDESKVPIEYELLKDVVALDLELLDTKIDNVDDEIVHVRITLQDEPDILASCSWGLIFAIGVMSFADARPRGYSEVDYVEDDQWFVGDMMRGLSFERGRLYFHADYVRGRCVKTSVEIDKDGKITVDTVNRGEAATRWIAKLMGKKTIGVLDGGDATTPETSKEPS